jgi:cellulose synthase operon protein C
MRGFVRRFWYLLLPALLLPVPACAQQDGASAAAAFREGRYEDAVRIATAATRADPDDEIARQALASALLDLGRYDDVIEAAASLPNARGEALRARGRLPEAEQAFREAAERDGPDRLSAEFNLAELLYRRGEVDEAFARFDRFIDVYNRSTSLGARDLVAVGNAVRYLGLREPQLFQDAVMAFDDAIAADPSDIEPHIRIGELFLEKYNSTEAQSALRSALERNQRNPRALLGLARTQAFDGDRGRAVETVRAALEINPNLVPARVFLARMLLEAEEYDEVEAELRRALEVEPTSLEALSAVAALHFVRGDQRRYEEARDQVRALNPRYAGLLTTTAEIAAQQRRYAEAAALAEEALRIDGRAWDAHGILGLNQFRLGRIEEARASLERSFEGDPYNVWIKNNLDLLDTFVNYEVRTVGGLQFMLHRDEADLLLPYLAEAATAAHADLVARYGDRPRGPVRVELYPRSADFSVRTVGLAGLGALGVSFGDVVALDSPAARTPGSYNWGVTLLHELAHTVALGVSNSRVPRWLTEGLSVFEERRARPGWKTSIAPELVLVHAAGELPPVSRLNEGFMRPASPQHLGYAYQLASHVIEWIDETRGFDAVLRMLHGYRDGRSTEQTFRDVMGMDAGTVDAQFDAWFRRRADPATAQEFTRLLAAGQRAFGEGDLVQARSSLEAAAALYPVSGAGSPYALLAQIHLRNGDERRAADALTVLTEHDENAYAANLELARLLESLGDRQGAARALERAVWIFPYEPAPHLRLAELYTELGEHENAVRERRAVLGLRPTDRADALYQLAAALLNAGDRDGARREVLRALELAPAFERAQQLLLRLHEGT